MADQNKLQDAYTNLHSATESVQTAMRSLEAAAKQLEEAGFDPQIVEKVKALHTSAFRLHGGCDWTTDFVKLQAFPDSPEAVAQREARAKLDATFPHGRK